MNQFECNAEMPQWFLMGSVRGNFIETFKTIIHNVYPAAIDSLFREPIPIQENMFPATTEESDELNATRIELIDFSRPSDYRLKAVIAKKQGHSAAAGNDEHLESSLSRGSIVSAAVSTGDSIGKDNPADGTDVIPDTELKPSVSERWKTLLTEKEIEAEEIRQKMRNSIINKLPIRETLDIKMKQLTDTIDW